MNRKVIQLNVRFFVCLILFSGSNLCAGVVSHYSFDSGYTDSTGNNNGTLVDVGTQGNSAITTAAGTYMFGGGAMDFSAEKDYISVALTTNSGAYAIAFWGKRRTSTEDWDIAFGRRTDGYNFFGLTVNDGQINGGGARFRANSSVNSDAQYPFDKAECTNWHHYAVSVTDDNKAIVYIDGVPLKTNTVASSFIYDAIGSGYTSDDHNFNGLMDELWFFDQAIDAETVNSLMDNNQFVYLPYSHYTFDSDYSDSVGNNNGRLVDAGTTGNSGITTTEGESCFGGGAVSFSADFDYVSLTRQTFSSNEAFSVTFWAKRADDTVNWDIVMGDNANTTDFIGLTSQDDQISTGGIRLRGDVSGHDVDGMSPHDTEWHHYGICVTTGNVATIYVDGVAVPLEGGNSHPSGQFRYNAIGSGYNSSASFQFNGMVDEVWVFKDAITADAVRNLMLSNDPVADAKYPVLEYEFDGNYLDSSFSANDGTASGNATITYDANEVVVGSGALQLDGADSSYVALDSAISFSSANTWSIAFWARRGETGNQKGMVAGELGSTDDFIWLNDNFNGFRFRSSNNTTCDFNSPKDTLLHHYALVADGSGGLSLYIDGEFSSSLSDKDTSFRINAVGQAYSTATLHFAFQGQIDDFRVYGEVLDADDVAALYARENEEAATITKLYVCLQAGQSNADGRAVTSGLPASLQQPQSDVDFYYKVAGGSVSLTTLRPGLSGTGGFGPEITCGRRLADVLMVNESNRVAIIKYAIGGTSLSSDWKAGGDATTTGDGPEYVTFQQTVTNGLAVLAARYPDAEIVVLGMTWMQGETDAGSVTTSEAYYANLVDFIADVRLTFNDANMPFVIGRLSSGQTAINATNLQTVRDAQDLAGVTVRLTGVVDTDTFGVYSSDHLHFDADGQQSLGSAFAELLLYFELRLGTVMILY